MAGRGPPSLGLLLASLVYVFLWGTASARPSQPTSVTVEVKMAPNPKKWLGSVPKFVKLARGLEEQSRVSFNLKGTPNGVEGIL
jgi:hypothetical protein